MFQSDHYAPNRPLVVLAGWLGCKPQSLRRYAKVYERLGFNVLIRIPSPSMIVLASISSTEGKETDVNCEGQVYDGKSKVTTMDQLASLTINDILNLDCSMWVVHLFSNGGCFLWDAMERKLRTSGRLKGSLYGLKYRLRGTVFDSSPADYRGTVREVENRINHALMQCTVKERMLLKFDLFLRGKSLKCGLSSAEEFWKRMKDCDWPLPQLYIFSENDLLTPSKPLRDLINFRKHKFGDLIQSKAFSSSGHCGHILAHPRNYTETLTSFLEFCCHHSPSNHDFVLHERSRL